MIGRIWTINDKNQEKFLRTKAKDFDFSSHAKAEIDHLIKRMRASMKAAGGIGLSANQIGLNAKVFVAQVPKESGGTAFYAIFNPKIEKTSKETISYEEGCLSIPGVWGDVERAEKISISGYDRKNKSIKIKAWGLLARVFQHEIDHLNGILFIDRSKNTYAEPSGRRFKSGENLTAREK